MPEHDPNRLLAGQSCTHSITNQPAVWIAAYSRAEAETLGLQIDSPADLILGTTCLAIRAHCHEKSIEEQDPSRPMVLLGIVGEGIVGEGFGEGPGTPYT